MPVTAEDVACPECGGLLDREEVTHSGVTCMARRGALILHAIGSRHGSCCHRGQTRVMRMAG